MRALSPHIGAVCRIGGEPFKVWSARARAEGAPPGLTVSDGRLIAGCGEGSLEVLELQPPGPRAHGRGRLPARMARGARVGGAAMSRDRRPARGSRASAAWRCACCGAWTTGAYADRALAAEARRADLDPRSRAQATRLAYGAVQRRRTLDWLIDGALDRPAALEPAVRDILRIGAYEIAFSDGVPDHAVVDQAVRQARALRGPKARVVGPGGRGQRGHAPHRQRRRRRASPSSSGAAPTTAALRYSMPDWIAERLVASLGSEEAIARDGGRRRARGVGAALEPAARPAGRARGRAAARAGTATR